MSEGSSGGFASFLRSSADKLSSKKGENLVTPETKGKDRDTADTEESKAKSQKEHRRAQVRKAQIEHRQRKEHLIKHLEQDVIRLRDMVSAAETGRAAIKHENASISTLLSKYNISTNTISSTNVQTIQHTASPSGFTKFQPLPQRSPQTDPEFQSPQYSNWSSNSPSSDVSVTYDEFINATCLQVSPHGSFGNSTVSNSPDISNLLAKTIPQLPRRTASSKERLQKPLPPLPPLPSEVTSSKVVPLQPDISSIAVNFILALEHPCRSHFNALPSKFDPTGNPTGHELMASTLLYSHAPESIFTDLDSASWTAPSLELTQLWEMSRSLPKGDFEITPVQAWFMLSQNYEVGRVLENLEGLKKGIGKLVGCFAFGAVMDEFEFWEVVQKVISD